METLRRYFCVPRSAINYIRSTIESYDGMGVVRTLDPQGAYIELHIAPGCEVWMSALLDALKAEGIDLEEVMERRLVKR